MDKQTNGQSLKEVNKQKPVIDRRTGKQSD